LLVAVDDGLLDGESDPHREEGLLFPVITKLEAFAIKVLM